MCDGIAAELEGIDLGDRRLNKRSVRIVEVLAAAPSESINAATEGWTDTFAAYRFFSNPNVHADEILRPHRAATERRIREHAVVLLVQDTTEYDFSAHPPSDVQCLETPERFGFYDHTHLAATPDQLCLGVVGTEQFDRTPETLGKTRERRSLPIEEQESFRWLTGYRLASELRQSCPTTQIISVADCEADIYELFVEGQRHPTPADFIIRAKENRCTPQRDPERGTHTYQKVHDQLAQAEVRVRRTVDLPQTPKPRARKAELEIRALTIELKPPAARSSLPRVSLQFVLVSEVNGPGDGTDVSWLLRTNLPIDTDEAILQIIDYYIAR